MTIRNMTTSKKIIKFIDSILNNNINDSSKIMKETSSIPSGGLRGLVYSKLSPDDEVVSLQIIGHGLDIIVSGI